LDEIRSSMAGFGSISGQSKWHWNR